MSDDRTLRAAASMQAKLPELAKLFCASLPPKAARALRLAAARARVSEGARDLHPGADDHVARHGWDRVAHGAQLQSRVGPPGAPESA